MPLFTYTCPKCKHQIDRLFLTYKESEEKKELEYPCPKCKTQTTRDEIQIPAKFMGCYGEVWLTAPSKRHSTKKINKDKTNAG